jgi:predicted RND superfamily exporter protein
VVSLIVLAGGVPYLYYAADLGWGERSFVVRSFRFIEANLRKSETLDLSVQIPQGTRIYDESSLRLLADVEHTLERDPYTGRVWSFLDLLEEAYRIDHGSPASSLDELIRSTRRSMPMVASFEQKQAFWSETTTEEPSGELRQADRARISADRGFLGAETQAYAERMRTAVKELQQRYAGQGYEIELEGGVVLLDLFLTGLQATEWESFAAAFGIVVLALALLLRRGGFALLFWAIVANLLPVVAVLGLMGWAGIGIDPANAMLGAILLVIVVDDTIHMALRYQRERAEGRSVREALVRCFRTFGEAILTSSLCLSLGFSVLLTAQWGGLVFFGLLAAVGVILALVGDLLLLPAALLVSAGGTTGRPLAPGQRSVVVKSQ